ncbi:unnamed protein product [Adineta ricciae]|uniref:Uncharacterized protein n=1 Tax=Adineta ricciae TaxID=249248 RepID=A0A815G622_ADIRI|nr:unnamed protein product [Adineta ricciae]
MLEVPTNMVKENKSVTPISMMKTGESYERSLSFRYYRPRLLEQKMKTSDEDAKPRDLPSQMWHHVYKY